MSPDVASESTGSAFAQEFARWKSRGLGANHALAVMLMIITMGTPRPRKGAKWRAVADEEDVRVMERLAAFYSAREPAIFASAPMWEKSFGTLPRWASNEGAKIIARAKPWVTEQGRTAVSHARRGQGQPATLHDVDSDSFVLAQRSLEEDAAPTLGRNAAGELEFGVRATRDALGGRRKRVDARDDIEAVAKAREIRDVAAEAETETLVRRLQAEREGLRSRPNAPAVRAVRASLADLLLGNTTAREVARQSGCSKAGVDAAWKAERAALALDPRVRALLAS